MPATLPRIAVDLRALVATPTGIGIYTLALLTRLAGRGSATYVGMAHREPHAVPELRAAGIEVETQPAPYGTVWQQLVLPRRLARGDIDLFWSPLFTLPLRSRVAGVVTVHDLSALLFPETHRLKVRASLLPLLRPSLDRARRVVTLSDASARDLRFHFPEIGDRLRVVRPGVDPAFRPAAPAEIGATRQELSCPDGYLLYAGTLEPRKNVPLLLDAWEALRLEDRAPPLVLAGPAGWRDRALRRRIEALRPLGLHPLGRLERARLVRVIQGATVFVYPSLYEGFGLPVAEAMACGIPTIAADAGSLPEVLGDAGLLVDPGDARGLAEAIERLLRTPSLAAELGAAATERARGFRWERAAAEMDVVFGEALAGPRPEALAGP